MKNTEIVFVCKSTNNKNIRANELKILKKHPEELYFIFGESNVNAKKRYYEDLETLNDDYAKVSKLRKELQKEVSSKRFNSRNSSLENNVEE